MRKKNKAKYVSKKILLKGNIGSKYIKWHPKILELVVSLFTYTDYSVLVHAQNIEKQYH